MRGPIEGLVTDLAAEAGVLEDLADDLPPLGGGDGPQTRVERWLGTTTRAEVVAKVAASLGNARARRLCARCGATAAGDAESHVEAWLDAREVERAERPRARPLRAARELEEHAKQAAASPIDGVRNRFERLARLVAFHYLTACAPEHRGEAVARALARAQTLGWPIPPPAPPKDVTRFLEKSPLGTLLALLDGLGEVPARPHDSECEATLEALTETERRLLLDEGMLSGFNHWEHARAAPEQARGAAFLLGCFLIGWRFRDVVPRGAIVRETRTQRARAIDEGSRKLELREVRPEIVAGVSVLVGSSDALDLRADRLEPLPSGPAWEHVDELRAR